jgi:hypothetical protein
VSDNDWLTVLLIIVVLCPIDVIARALADWIKGRKS